MKRRVRPMLSVLVSVAMSATVLAVISASPAQADTTPNTAPAGLLNIAALNAPDKIKAGIACSQTAPCPDGNYYPGGVYSATAAQRASLQLMQDRAIAAVIHDHALNQNDGPAVLSWGRADAQAQLWALLQQSVQAVHDGTADQDQLNVNAWLSAMLKRQGVLMADNAGLEYTKWAGLGTASYNTLLQSNPTESQLASFLGTTPNPWTGTGSAANPAGSTDGGFCAYRSPAPFSTEYNSYVGSGNAPQTCFGPCTDILTNCPPPTPTYEQFAKWGASTATASLYSKFGSPEAAEGIAKGGEMSRVASVSSGLAGVALSAAIGTAAFGAALGPLSVAATTTFEAALSTALAAGVDSLAAESAALSATESVAGALSVSGVGVIVAAIIFAITTAITVGLNVISASQVPTQLASLITKALGADPDPYAVLTNSTNASSLFALFVGATLPAPTFNTCDNTFVIGGSEVQSQCQNPTAIPGPSEFDPQWIVTPDGSNTSTTQSTLTWKDDTGGGATLSAYLHGNWFIDSLTGSTSGVKVQGLRMHYTDWSGVGHTAWLFGNLDPTGFLSITDNQLGPTFDPTACINAGKCGFTHSIQVIAADGSKETVSVQPGIEPPPIPPAPACAVPTCEIQNTDTTIISGPTTVAVGETATYTAYVRADSQVTGSVDFDLGFTPACSDVPLVPPDSSDHIQIVAGKVARCTVTFDQAGQQVLFATYTGNDSGYQSSQGGRAITAVMPTTTSTSATANDLAPSVGETVTLSATVTPNVDGYTPTGTVEFDDGSAVLCPNAPLSASAPFVATCSATFSDVSTHLISAGYSGDVATQASGDGFSITPRPAGTTTIVSSTPTSATAGASVTLVATVATPSTLAAPPVPTGTVDFGLPTCNDVALSTTAPYQASCPVTYPDAGTEHITASYAGSALTAASNGGYDLAVGKAPTTVSVDASTQTPVVGQSVTYTATVTTDAPSTAAPSAGTVSFTGVTGCTGLPLSATSPYQVTCVGAPPAAGALTVSATYSGGTNSAGSTGSVDLAVGQASTSVAVTSAPSTFGQSLAITATVSPVAPSSGGPARTGTVTFSVDGNAAAPVTISGNVAHSVPVTDLAPGTHTLSATYSGDANYLGSTGTGSQSVTCTQTISRAVSGSITVSGSTCVSGVSVTGSITVNRGGSLALVNATVGGAITTTGASSVRLCGSSVAAKSSIKDTTGAVVLGGPACDGDTVSSPLTISGTLGAVTVSGGTFTSGLSVTGNRGPVWVTTNAVGGGATISSNVSSTTVAISANTVKGGLSCTRNSPTPTDLGTQNSVSGKVTGQCIALS